MLNSLQYPKNHPKWHGSSVGWLRHCLHVVFAAAMLLGMSSPALASFFSYVETQTNGHNGVVGLDGISDVAVSADGQFVYTAAYSASAISVFERNPQTGALSYRSSIAGAINAFSVAVSPDNHNVYAASPTGGNIFAYSRNIETGALTEIGSFATSGGTSGFVSVSVSPDGAYVFGVGGSPSGLVVFGRDSDTGGLTVLHDYKDNVDGHALGQQFSSSTSPIKNIVFSESGQFVYVTSTKDNAVTLFQQSPTDGALLQIAVYQDGVNGVDGLLGASSATRSPDGKHLYVSGQSDDSIAMFSIHAENGELTYSGKITNNEGVYTQLAGVRSLAITHDGKLLVASAITANALTVFTRNAATGALTLDSEINNNEDGVIGLSGPSGIAIDARNQNLYVAGQSDMSLVVFAAPMPSVYTHETATREVAAGERVILDANLTINSGQDSPIIAASVSIGTGFVPGDVLSMPSVVGITAVYNAQTGILQLTGQASAAHYQAALRQVAFQASLARPVSNSEQNRATRLIHFQVTNLDNYTSVPATLELIVTMAEHAPPSNSRGVPIDQPIALAGLALCLLLSARRRSTARALAKE